MMERFRIERLVLGVKAGQGLLTQNAKRKTLNVSKK